jgi:hypothetical protein
MAIPHIDSTVVPRLPMSDAVTTLNTLHSPTLFDFCFGINITLRNVEIGEFQENDKDDYDFSFR